MSNFFKQTLMAALFGLSISINLKGIETRRALDVQKEDAARTEWVKAQITLNHVNKAICVAGNAMR